MVTNSPPPRKRGAPKGNLNALKHGRYLVPDSLAVKISANSVDLAREIKILKHFMCLAYEDAQNSLSPLEVRTILQVLSLAGLSLSRLVSLQQRLDLKPSSTAAGSKTTA